MEKVLVVGSPALTFGVEMRNGFTQSGFKADYFNYRLLQLQRTSFTNKLLNKYLLKKVRQTKPDLLLVTKGETILPETIKKVCSEGVKTVLWVLDEPFGKYESKNTLPHISEFDFVLSFDKSYVASLTNAGAKNCSFLPVGIDPEFHEERIPLTQRKYIADVSLVGTHYKNREEVLLKINDKIKNIRILGHGWNKKVSNDSPLHQFIQKKTALGAKCDKEYNLSKINLNTYHEHAVDGGLNLRVYEVLATKSFLLTSYLKSIEEQFVPEKEISCFKTPEEALEKCEEYLADDEKRNKIAIAGYERVLKDHTTAVRAKQIAKIVWK